MQTKSVNWCSVSMPSRVGRAERIRVEVRLTEGDWPSGWKVSCGLNWMKSDGDYGGWIENADREPHTGKKHGEQGSDGGFPHAAFAAHDKNFVTNTGEC